MDKSAHFFGTSVFAQLISLIDPRIIPSITKKLDADRYVRRFKSKGHLMSMPSFSFNFVFL
ncbi:MAG TPA: DUF4372 domain-containing protein [Bacteroidales bacterium]|nr:DUF4372 domain-containing protein [Bacteroidales bacterium]